MQDIAVSRMRQPAEGGLLKTRGEESPSPMVLCSQVPGRERWYVEVLEDNPRLAAAVEVVLKSEEGILDARANPITGRVLVRYRPDSLAESTEALIHRALAFGPMSDAEFSAFRSTKKPVKLSFRHLLAAEIACSAINMVVLGEFCPFVLGAVGLHLLMHRHA